MHDRTITILGLGNLLMMDEGVGVHAVQAIQDGCSLSPDVEVVDGGASGLDLLPYIEHREKLLVLDAVDFGREPGFIGMIENDDIPAFLQSKVSMHHLGLADVLSVAKLMNASPKEICLIGVQPHTVDLGLDMSPAMWDKIPTLLDRVGKKLEQWGASCVLQSPQKSSPSTTA